MTTYAGGAAYTLEHRERPTLVVALHGLTGTRAQPLVLLEGSDVPSLGVFAPDLRAHGDTQLDGAAADFTPHQLAVDIEELLRHADLQARHIVLLGISLGATVALELLRRRNLDVLACVFVRPAHGTQPAPHLRLNARIAAWLREDPGTALDQLTGSDDYRAVAAVSARAAASLRDKVAKPRSVERAMRLEQGASWIAFTTGELFDDAPPTLILAADADPHHPVAVAVDWQRRIQGSELVVLPAWDIDPAAHETLARSTIGAFLSEAAATAEPR